MLSVGSQLALTPSEMRGNENIEHGDHFSKSACVLCRTMYSLRAIYLLRITFG